MSQTRYQKKPYRPRKKYSYRGGDNEHRRVVERILEHPLPPKAEVHHRDGNGKNNDPNNLVVCEDRAYHRLLHLREEAYRATGNPNARRCMFCSKWGDPTQPDSDLIVRHRKAVKESGVGHALHRSCEAKYANRRYHAQQRGGR